MNWEDTKLFILENGIAHVRDNNHNEIIFETIADLERCTSVSFEGHKTLIYEPDREIYIDSEDDSIDETKIPNPILEGIIDTIVILHERLADPTYGIEDDLKESVAREHNKRKAIEAFSITFSNYQQHKVLNELGFAGPHHSEHKDRYKKTMAQLQEDIANPSTDVKYVPPNIDLWDHIEQTPIIEAVSITILREGHGINLEIRHGMDEPIHEYSVGFHGSVDCDDAAASEHYNFELIDNVYQLQIPPHKECMGKHVFLSFYCDNLYQRCVDIYPEEHYRLIHVPHLPAWDPEEYYEATHKVIYKQKIYVAKTKSQGVEPGKHGDIWEAE